MPKHRRLRRSAATVVGIAWFDRDQWQLLHDIAADRDKLDDTFEQWEANARRALAELKSQGVAVAPFDVRVEQLVHWCAERNVPVDGAARAEYVSLMLKRKHAGG